MSDFAAPAAGRMRLLALSAFMMATSPGLLPAQRIERSGVTMRELRTEVTTPAVEPFPLATRLSEDRKAFAGGVVGAVLGVVAGYNIGLANQGAETKRNCHEDFYVPAVPGECMGPAFGALLGGVIGFALGAFVTMELVARDNPLRAFHGWRLRLRRLPVRSAWHPRLRLARTP